MNLLHNGWFLLTILLYHWLWDFVLQQHKDASNKWRSNEALINHTLFYSLAWIPFTVVIGPKMGWFVLITFITHTLIDRQTAKLSRSYYLKEDYHKFFNVIGFDQILHYVQLYLTFKLLL